MAMTLKILFATLLLTMGSQAFAQATPETPLTDGMTITPPSSGKVYTVTIGGAGHVIRCPTSIAVSDITKFELTEGASVVSFDPACYGWDGGNSPGQGGIQSLTVNGYDEVYCSSRTPTAINSAPMTCIARFNVKSPPLPGWKFVNATSCPSASGPTCATPQINMVGADLIIEAITWYGGGPLNGPTDNQGNNYNLGVSITNTDTGHTTTKCYFKQAPTVSGTMSFSADFGGSNGVYPAISVLGFSGSIPSPLDKTNQANSNNALVASQQPGSATPSLLGELAVACLGVGDSDGAISGIAIDSGYSLSGAINFVPGVMMGGALGWFVLPNKSSTNPKFSWTGPTYGNAGTMLFK